MYKIICEINDSTCYAIKEKTIFVLKKIDASQIDVYKLMMKIINPNIAQHYEFTSIDDSLFVVEEYIKGVTLEEYCKNNYPLSNDRIVEIAKGICNGLSAIHRLGLVHRDITPTNIMIDANGNPVIIDFGISRITNPTQAKDTQILGTYGYAAPEQFGFNQTNQRADIYSMGVLINYMSTQKLPNEQLAKGKLEHVIRKCIEMDTNKRYANIDELSNALESRSIEALVRAIPGFRQGTGWHILVASLYYAMLPLAFYILYTSGKATIDKICNVFIGIFSLIVTIPIVTNLNSWLDKWSFTKKLSKSGKIAVQISLVLICIVISIVFILIPQH